MNQNFKWACECYCLRDTKIIFFSAVVPCIMSTSIPIKMRDLIIIWVERVILSILLAGVVALIFL